MLCYMVKLIFYFKLASFLTEMSNYSFTPHVYADPPLSPKQTAETDPYARSAGALKFTWDT